MYREKNLYLMIAAMIELARRDIRKCNAYADSAASFLAWCEGELSIYLRLGDE